MASRAYLQMLQSRTWGDFWSFALTPNYDQRRIMEAIGVIGRAQDRIISLCVERGDDEVWDGPLGSAGGDLLSARKKLEEALGFTVPASEEVDGPAMDPAVA